MASTGWLNAIMMPVVLHCEHASCETTETVHVPFQKRELPSKVSEYTPWGSETSQLDVETQCFMVVLEHNLVESIRTAGWDYAYWGDRDEGPTMLMCPVCAEKT